MAPADPVKLLQEFMTENAVSPAALAREIGTGHTMVGRILSRARRPGAQIIARIERFTGRRVLAHMWGDWFDYVDDRAAKKSA